MKKNTWYWILLSGLSILLVGLVVACVSAPGSAPTAQPTPTEQPEKSPAQFEVSALNAKPGTVMVGYPATVAATISNSGDLSGTYTACLMIDGQETERKYVTLAPGATREVSFQVTKAAVGSYKLSVGEASAVLDVYDWTPQTIQYDSGVYDPQFMGTYMWGGWGQIVHFTPLTKPFKIQKISISAHTKVANFADLRKRMFTVRIWNEHKTQQLWSDDFPWDLFQTMGWQDIDVPDIITDGDFHVEVVTNSDAPPSNNFMALNYEKSKDELRSGVSLMGQVAAAGNYAARDKRWFIRVKGQGPPATLVQEEDQTEPEAELATLSPKLVYEDDFSDPNSGWGETSAKEGEDYYRDGEYHILVKVKDWATWEYNENAGRFKDFIMEEDARPVSGPKYSAYGLIFRCQDNDNFYLFTVSEDGRYKVGKFLSRVWSDLHSWTKSAFIETGNSTNHLKVVCEGSQIEVYANGHYLTTVVDGSFVVGYVGGIVYAFEPNAHVAFDNLKVYSLTPETP